MLEAFTDFFRGHDDSNGSSRTAERRVELEPTSREEGFRRLFPEIDSRSGQLAIGARDVMVSVTVFEKILRDYQSLSRLDGATSGPNTPADGTGGVLIGDSAELRQRDRLHIIDCLSAHGESSNAWRFDSHGLRAELDWYGRNARGVFFAGEWQHTSPDNFDRPLKKVAGEFAKLVDRDESPNVPAALLLHVNVRHMQSKLVDMTNVWEGGWQLHHRGFLWQCTSTDWRTAEIRLDRNSRPRIDEVDRPWYLHDRRRFDRELKTLATFAADVKASFLSDMRAAFLLTDPAWLDELVLITPHRYPRAEPLVLLQRQGGEDVRQVDLTELGVRWTEDSLLARVVYALERRSRPDGG